LRILFRIYLEEESKSKGLENVGVTFLEAKQITLRVSRIAIFISSER